MATSATPADALIHARGLTKRFANLIAVDGIDFDVHRGEAFGFLGPNGAGKTSTMRMIGCVSPPSSGVLRVIGKDPVAQASEIKARIGVVPQIDNLDLELTVRENLAMDEGETLGDRLVVMDKARIVAEGSPRALIRQYCPPEVLELRLTDEARGRLETVLDGLGQRVEWLPDRVLLYTDEGDSALATIH